MQTYRIEFRKHAEKFLNSRPLKERQRLLSEIAKLPYAKDVKKMVGYANRYRLRVGDFRVIYEIHNDVLLIIVLEIGNRGDIYK